MAKPYFTRALFDYLKDLAANNDRDWFKPRKPEFERLIKSPMEALCVALAQEFDRLRLPLEADPKRSPFRIYRDVRFSKDKSPYKTAQGADFPWNDSRGDLDRPRGAVGGYFHLEPGNIFVGGGMWHPERARLAAFREKIDRDPSAVFRAIEDARFRSVFGSVTVRTPLLNCALILSSSMPAGSSSARWKCPYLRSETK